MARDPPVVVQEAPTRLCVEEAEQGQVAHGVAQATEPGDTEQDIASVNINFF